MRTTLKRMSAPKTWPIGRKSSTFVLRPSPGPHSREKSIPLGLAVKEFLKLGDTGREVRRIIGQKFIYVDGKPCRDFKRPVGIMDVISIPSHSQSWRVLLDTRNKIRLVPIQESQAKWKLVRIENKRTIRGGKFQLNLHDGRNIVIDKNMYKCGDVLKISLPDQKILEVYPFEKGNVALIVGGHHTGELATINVVSVTREVAANKVSFVEGHSTTRKNVFVVGKAKPEITLPEVRIA
ncbi:MAG: 30S ribosomal protein S4e [Thermoplasmata archaeon]